MTQPNFVTGSHDVRRKTTDEQIDRSAAAARAAMAGEFGAADEPAATTVVRARAGNSDDTSLDHYLKRIDPKVAASFTAPQRQAIRTMLGTRGTNRHAVDFRRSFALGRSRYYAVLLLGREHRSLARLHRERIGSGAGYFFRYLAFALLLLLPILGAVYVLKALAGVDVMAASGL